MTLTISLGGIALPADNFTWALRTGLQPHIARVQVPLPIHARLLQLASPTTLVLDATGCGGARLQFAGVHLAGFSRAAGGTDFRWQLADARIGWRGQRISGRYNIPGELNDAELAEAGATAAASGEPAFPAARFLDATLNPATQQPWTALQLAAHLLQQLDAGGAGGAGVAGGAFVATQELDDNRVIAPAHALHDADPLALLPPLLAEAGVEVAALADGTLRLVPHADTLDAYAPPGAAAALAEGNAGAARVDAIALRPHEVVVRARRELQREFRFVTDDDRSSTTSAVAPEAGTRLINVLRLPRDEQLRAWSERTARTWPAGSFVPVADALAAWGVADQRVRTRWFAGGLERELAASGGDGNGHDESGNAAWSAVWLQRVAAIRAHWRQTFAIDPRDLRELIDWRPARMTRPDRQTKRAARSMAFAAHTIIPPVRPPATALAAVGRGGRSSGAGSAARRIVVAGGGGASSNVPFGEVQVLDAASGVFHVRAVHVPGTVRDDTIPPATLDASAATWAGAEIDAAWELIVPLAVTPAAGDQRWHDLVLSHDAEAGAGLPGAARAAGPAVRVEQTEEPARIDSVHERAVLNAGNLHALARRAARRIWRQHRPRWRGRLEYEGLHELPPPNADVRCVMWRVAADGRCTTAVALAE